MFGTKESQVKLGLIVASEKKNDFFFGDVKQNTLLYTYNRKPFYALLIWGVNECIFWSNTLEMINKKF